MPQSLTCSLQTLLQATVPLDQVHGFPRVMGVLTHLDGFRDDDKLKKVKKALKHRFWTEIYQGMSLAQGLLHKVKLKQECFDAFNDHKYRIL